LVIKLKSAQTAFWALLLALCVVAAVFLSTSKEEGTETNSQTGAPMLIIDAGHGGTDGGAVSVTGVPESEINLSIAIKLRALAQLLGLPCIMTRETEEIDYPEDANSLHEKKVYDTVRRVELAESEPGCVLISIHQNKFPASSPRGPQAFFGKDGNSEVLALLAQEKLTAALWPENRRVAAPIPKKVYLFSHISCTSLLAECGYLSNPTEARLLETDGHQIKAALALASAYIEFISAENKV
jgi:N-acetylmuramoyl-L-alanine amidase